MGRAPSPAVVEVDFNFGLAYQQESKARRGRPPHMVRGAYWLSIGGVVSGVSWSQMKNAISFAGSLSLALAETW